MEIKIELSTYDSPAVFEAVHTLIETAKLEAIKVEQERGAIKAEAISPMPEALKVLFQNHEEAKAAGEALTAGLQEGIKAVDEPVAEAAKTLGEKAYDKAQILREIKTLGRKLVAAGVKTSEILKKHGGASISAIPEENYIALLEELKAEEAKI